MTPEPTPSAAGSSQLPPPRSEAGASAKDKAEAGLWAFDEIDTADEPPVVAHPVLEPTPPKKEAHPDSVHVNIGKSRPTGEAMSAPLKDTGALEDLDQWAGPTAEPVRESAASQPVPPSPPPTAEVSPPIQKTAAVSRRPRLALSKIEWFGLAALVVLLLSGGGVALFKGIGRLPTESVRVRSHDFPVKGQHLTILSADSYWRAPIMEGGSMDAVRRGTLLLPVVSLTSSGDAAAVRVLFRNSDGEVVGDAVTRTLRAGASLQVAATAGFSDLGVYAAYRADQGKPWTIHVYEASSENAPNPDFKKLFEMNISPARR